MFSVYKGCQPSSSPPRTATAAATSTTTKAATTSTESNATATTTLSATTTSYSTISATTTSYAVSTSSFVLSTGIFLQFPRRINFRVEFLFAKYLVQTQKARGRTAAWAPAPPSLLASHPRAKGAAY